MSGILDRSNAHWSEAGRAEMDAFYRLATDDYRHLALARDWKGFFEAEQARVGERGLRLLDVACGSGKFPNALARHAGLGDARISPIDTALLDPSAFSIAEARAALPAPFRAGAELEITLQELDVPEGGYDVVWATHALYAIPEAELGGAMAKFVSAIAPGGTGIVAHSGEAGHYVRFHERYLESFDVPGIRRYVSAETVAAALEAAGASVDVQEIAYDSVAGPDDVDAVEGYLQRCAFDDSRSLQEMLAGEPLGGYLRGCRDETGWRFGQRAHLMTVTA